MAKWGLRGRSGPQFAMINAAGGPGSDSIVTCPRATPCSRPRGCGGMRSATLHAWATNSASSGSSSQRDVTECHKALPARPSAAGSSGLGEASVTPQNLTEKRRSATARMDTALEAKSGAVPTEKPDLYAASPGGGDRAGGSCCFYVRLKAGSQGSRRFITTLAMAAIAMPVSSTTAARRGSGHGPRSMVPDAARTSRSGRSAEASWNRPTPKLLFPGMALRFRGSPPPNGTTVTQYVPGSGSVWVSLLSVSAATSLDAVQPSTWLLPTASTCSGSGTRRLCPVASTKEISVRSPTQGPSSG